MSLTPKQEAFCLAYIETGNATESYKSSYNVKTMSDNAIAVEACRMIDSPNISLRLKELREPIIARHGVTVDSLINELEEARQVALESAQSSAAVSATMGKAKITGYDKQVVDHISSDNSMTPKAVVIGKDVQDILDNL